MTRREIAFLLIGLGFGLMLAAWAVVSLIYSHMFILGVSNWSGYVVFSLPFVLVIVGVILIFLDRSRA